MTQTRTLDTWTGDRWLSRISDAHPLHNITEVVLFLAHFFHILSVAESCLLAYQLTTGLYSTVSFGGFAKENVLVRSVL